jgi:hypothetical protein
LEISWLSEVGKMTMRLNLRDVDRELVKRAKRAAIDRDLTLKQFILDAVARALPSDSEPRQNAPKGDKR